MGKHVRRLLCARTYRKQIVALLFILDGLSEKDRGGGGGTICLLADSPLSDSMSEKSVQKPGREGKNVHTVKGTTIDFWNITLASSRHFQDIDIFFVIKKHPTMSGSHGCKKCQKSGNTKEGRGIRDNMANFPPLLFERHLSPFLSPGAVSYFPLQRSQTPPHTNSATLQRNCRKAIARARQAVHRKKILSLSLLSSRAREEQEGKCALTQLTKNLSPLSFPILLPHCFLSAAVSAP